MKFAISYSFGKDSALSLWRMKSVGHEPVCMITTVNKDAGLSWFHGIDYALMDAVSESLGIPLIKCVCSGGDYQAKFETCLTEARKMGAEACVFGDIDIAGHLDWNRSRCAAAGLDCLLPLWQEDREAIANEIVTEGFKAIIKCVQSEYLNDSFLGLTLTREVLDKIRATGSDICGENGEYHTFVCDGPAFNSPVPVRLGKIADLGSHSAIDMSLC